MCVCIFLTHMHISSMGREIELKSLLKDVLMGINIIHERKLENLLRENLRNGAKTVGRGFLRIEDNL